MGWRVGLPRGTQGLNGTSCLVTIPGSGRSPGEGNGNPLQDSGLENSLDLEAWQATVHGWQRVRQD